MIGIILRELESGPKNHWYLADKAAVPPWRMSASLNNLKRTGRVVCVKKSDRGRNPKRPGIWAEPAKAKEVLR